MRIWRLIAFGFCTMALISCTGCGLAPKTFRSIKHPAPLVRARSVGLSERLPEEQAVPVLVDRLEDSDPVVRLAAHQELKRRTGQDFGYVPWEEPEPRAKAVSRWKNWVSDRFGASRGAKVVRRQPRLASPQSTPTSSRITMPAPPTLPSGQQ